VLSERLGWSRYYAVGWLQTCLDNVATGKSPHTGTPHELLRSLPPHVAHNVDVVNPLIEAGELIERQQGTLEFAHWERIRRKREARSAAGKLGAEAKHKKRAPTVVQKRPEREALVLRAPAVAAKKVRSEGKTMGLWPVWAQMHVERYGVPPLRNEKSMGQLAQLLKRIPQNDAVDFLRFYLGHPDYERQHHEIGAALAKAEQLWPQYLSQRHKLQRDIDKQSGADVLAAQVGRIQRGEI